MFLFSYTLGIRGLLLLCVWADAVNVKVGSDRLIWQLTLIFYFLWQIKKPPCWVHRCVRLQNISSLEKKDLILFAKAPQFSWPSSFAQHILRKIPHRNLSSVWEKPRSLIPPLTHACQIQIHLLQMWQRTMKYARVHVCVKATTWKSQSFLLKFVRNKFYTDSPPLDSPNALWAVPSLQRRISFSLLQKSSYGRVLPVRGNMCLRRCYHYYFYDILPPSCLRPANKSWGEQSNKSRPAGGVCVCVWGAEQMLWHLPV